MSNDGEIFDRARARPAAFAELYDRHAPAIYRYAARRTTATGAEDVMAETFLVAFERREEFDRAMPTALPWLYGIATRLLRKHARLEAAAWRGVVADGAAAIAPDRLSELDDRLDAEVAIRRLGRALRRMPHRDRDVLLLYAWGDLGYDDIATALDIPIGTVRSRLNRARRTLRHAVDTDHANDTDAEVEHGRLDPAAERP